MLYGGGKIGWPLGCWLTERGHQLHVIDVVEDVVDTINAGAYMVPQDLAFPSIPIRASLPGGVDIQPSDMAMICVPTPTPRDGGEFDVSYVQEAFRDITTQLHEYGTRRKPYPVVVVSTVSEGGMQQVWESRECDEAYVELYYAPVMVAIGSIPKNLDNADAQVLGVRQGYTRHITSPGTVEEFYADLFGDRLAILTWGQAEMVKLGINNFLSYKVTWAIQYALLCSRLGIEPKGVLAAIGMDHRIGHSFLGVGTIPSGVCLPRDVLNLVCIAARLLGNDSPTEFPAITLPYHERQMELLRITNAAIGKRVGIVGMSYKTGVDIRTDSFGTWVSRVTPDALIWDDYAGTASEFIEECDLVIMCHPYREMYYAIMNSAHPPDVIDPYYILWRAGGKMNGIEWSKS